MFVLPSLIFGIILSFPALYGIYHYLFEQNLGLEFIPVPSVSAFLQACAVGILIPLFSSIMPIQSAMTRNLSDALDYNRSKTQAVYVKILDKSKRNISTLVVFGVLAVTYGISIYYFLPLSLLSFNFGMILRIFFFILLGMLLGLCLLAINFQRVLEVLLVYLCLWFETQSMRKLILKNLTAHKGRNKLTALIYALSLGFIIFLIVSYQMQITTSTLSTQKSKGAHIVFESYSADLRPGQIDSILYQ